MPAYVQWPALSGSRVDDAEAVALGIGGVGIAADDLVVRLSDEGEVGLGHERAVAGAVAAAGYRVDIGEPTETIGKRIRASELEKIPFTIVFGDRESEASLAVRERGGSQPGCRCRRSRSWPFARLAQARSCSA